MAYAKFTRKQLNEKFGIEFKKLPILPEEIPLIPPSDHLLLDMKEARMAMLNNEKAQSEFLITPILKEVWRNSNYSFGIHSGEVLDADPSQGLTGECDFILTSDTEYIEIKTPIISIVEAKFEQFNAGITQATAQLLGVQILNERAGLNIPELWGCSNNGSDWFFFKIEGKVVTQHTVVFSQRNVSEILGVWKLIIEKSLDMVKNQPTM